MVDAFLEHLEKWRDEHEKLRELCLACQLTEELKWGQPCYTLNNKNVVIIGGFKNYIALTFFKGALLKDKDRLLVQQTESVQAGRQLRFTSVEEISERETMIKAYIEESIEIEKAGLKVPVEKKAEIPIPDELQIKFHDDPAFKNAFYALTPGRQRGYIFYFNGAKMSETRISRIEKYMDKIFHGLGIDD
ncbi:YdeI/OmpD-associated family protein [Lacrimispora xylanisolvens]|uniref:YdeI/OmpD-associated family protein n=1 Tax=Lacrimispora xylanisolvens TaxID=384636 RepID=UPI0024026649